MLSSFNWSLVRLKYNGGDWYNDPSCLENLAFQFNERFDANVDVYEKSMNIAEAVSTKTPFLFMTGHGGLDVTDDEKRLFRLYLEEGGFIYIDDDYGFDGYVRKFISETFPELTFEQVSLEHVIYNWPYNFPDGLPKIHLHDGNSPEGWGIEINGRLSLFYTYESNISDGWADFRVHRDPESAREQAFRMGINIICYAMTH